MVGMRISIVTGAAVLVASGLSVDTAEAGSKPPVVKIVLNGSKHTVSGAKGLKAGWVTFQISAKDHTLHDLSVFSERPGSSFGKTKGIRAPEGVRRLERSGAGQGTDAPSAPGGSATPPSRAEVYSEQATGAKDGDRSLVSEGGARVSGTRGVDLTVRLPAGRAFVSDLFAGSIEITVAKGSGQGKPSKGNVAVSEGANNVIHAPKTLPRDGVLQISNTNSSGTGTHAIMLAKLSPGATKASIEKYFAPDNDFSHGAPFIDSPVTGGFNSLSPGYADYLPYLKLKAGKYAFIDVAIDEKSGHVHAEDGSIAFVTVK